MEPHHLLDVGRELQVSESGIRGVAGPGLDSSLVLACATAFGTGRTRVAVGRDTRASSAAFAHATIAGLLTAGCEVIDLGVVPTPTVQLVVQSQGLDGGVVVTASHNPAEYNALKLVGADGALLDRGEVSELYEEALDPPPWLPSFSPVVTFQPDALARHVARIAEVVDVEAIRRRSPWVAVDTSNGATDRAAVLLANALGFDAVVLHDEGVPPSYEASELPVHFSRLSEAVRVNRHDLGLGFDPDGNRLCLVDETGAVLRTDWTLALAAEAWLGRAPGPLVVNESTSLALDERAARFGVPCHRSAVGERNVVSRMKQVGAVIGGEGNGGVILPSVHHGRDALAAAALVLELVARSGLRLSELAAPFACWRALSLALPAESGLPDAVVWALSRELTEVPAASGRRLEGPRGWVTVREADTEPVVRVIAESTDEAFLEWVREAARVVVAGGPPAWGGAAQ